MFTFSKVITLGVLLAGTTGLSAYLIPFGMGNTSAQNTLFSNSNSLAENKNSKEFKEEEDQKLKILKPLLEKLEEAVKNSETFRDLKNQEMKDLFERISSTEEKLSKLYEKNLEVMKKLAKTIEDIFKQGQNKLKIQSNVEKAKSLRSLLEKISEFIQNREKLLTQVVEEINKNNASKNSEVSSSAGGAQDKKPKKA
ncbi:hypothetical protein, contains Powdery mildew resistance (RPW8) domain [Mycoplasma suis KI3806]|uniref:RPW8 domain-containing protein n=1 Tax=Mycoplasma suis (strain KI_3806) TaxID=708248 RepID=F0V211_MYCS3|nr:hypothetical protein [Mycoplasma suis]CBZ40692.1 hypothetical protein, contains Powdery mildew resistance (RPW8) domain [Mycoplasma suis KI3806]